MHLKKNQQSGSLLKRRNQLATLKYLNDKSALTLVKVCNQETLSGKYRGVNQPIKTKKARLQFVRKHLKEPARF